MKESPVFEFVAGELEKRTPLKRIEARGTLRLVLKQAGLEPRSTKGSQMAVVLRKLMPAALAKRKVDDAEARCEQIALALSGQTGLDGGESAYDHFRRLGRDERFET